MLKEFLWRSDGAVASVARSYGVDPCSSRQIRMEFMRVKRHDIMLQCVVIYTTCQMKFASITLAPIINIDPSLS
jgi:hypothetical protein